MVGVEHEDASAGGDGALARREQRTMLFCRPNKLSKHKSPRTHRKHMGGEGGGSDDDDGSAPGSD